VLSVRGLRKTFPARRVGQPGTVAIDAVDLDVAPGAFATVLGPSGSGKTTLLRCIAGFETPDDGVIALAGRQLVAPTTPSVRPHARGIGIVPQEGALFPHLNVAQNIGFGLHRASRTQRRSRVESLLELVDMRGLGDRRPHQLSGGQQQRVALARALATEPTLLLLDEPFSALDAKLRVELRDEVRSLLRQLGTTAVLVTHDQSEAMSMADHLVVMRDGSVVAAGDPRDIYDRPPDIEIGRVLGDATILPGRVVRDHAGIHVGCELGHLDVGHWHGVEGACQVLVRPEHLAVGPSHPTANGCEAVGVVTGLSYFGADALLRLAMRSSDRNVTVRVPGHCRHLAPGDLVAVTVTQPVCTYPTDDPGTDDRRS
jgi:iron(III) transport system ATP-binding protein